MPAVSVVLGGVAAQLLIPLHNNGWTMVILLFLLCPTIGAIVSIPRPVIRSFLVNSLIVSATFAIVVGINFRDIDEDVTDRIAFMEGFVIGLVPSLAGLLLALGVYFVAGKVKG
jgi:hypothetical protein